MSYLYLLFAGHYVAVHVDIGASPERVEKPWTAEDKKTTLRGFLPYHLPTALPHLPTITTP